MGVVIIVSQNATRMPVPCAFNDILPETAVRDHVGWTWYQRRALLPNTDDTLFQVIIRFGSVNYFAAVVCSGRAHRHRLCLHSTGMVCMLAITLAVICRLSSCSTRPCCDGI